MQTLQVPLDVATIIGVLFTTATIAFFTMLGRLLRTVDRIENKLGSSNDPDSVLGKLKEFDQLRDWAISKGFQHRGADK